MDVILDPRGGYRYMTYYIYGFLKVLGKTHIHYSIEPFKTISYSTREKRNSGCPILLFESNKTIKVFIDTEDRAKVEKDRYKWCDIYAKVNPEFGVRKRMPKIMYLGPEFGLRLQGKVSLVMASFYKFIKIHGRNKDELLGIIKDHLYTYIRRRSLSLYSESVPIIPNYVFHASTLWYNEFAALSTNKYRGDFLVACQKAGMKVEGGLFYVEGSDPVKEMPDYSKYKEIYKDFIYDRRLPMGDYIRKTKESVCVFNTPSVCECHGWKLAEYLCMGKAIISTPLTREMPGEGLIHGENVHFVKSPEEIYEAVVKINTDGEYRKKLEQGAKAYYKQWLAPEVVVKRIIDTALSLE